MANNQGWISLHRSITDHWIYQEKRTFSKYEAWLDILLDVNHQDNKIMFDGTLLEVKRGERITSIRQLTDKWGWSNSKVTRFLKALESDGMIIRKSDTKKTVITVVNYDKYQNHDLQKRQQNDNETTPAGQLSVTETPQTHTNNNDNNVNNENNDNKDKPLEGSNKFQYLENFNRLWEIYPKGRKQGKDKAFAAYKKAIKDGVADETIEKGIEAYKKQIEIQRTELQFIKQGSTWFNQKCWNDEYVTEGSQMGYNNGWNEQAYEDSFKIEQPSSIATLPDIHIDDLPF